MKATNIDDQNNSIPNDLSEQWLEDVKRLDSNEPNDVLDCFRYYLNSIQ